MPCLAMKEIVCLNFGHGKFGCLVKPLALIVLNKTFVEIGVIPGSEKGVGGCPLTGAALQEVGVLSLTR